MKVIRETIVAGRIIYRNIKASSGNHKGSRRARKNVTREKVQKNNDRMCVRNLMLLISYNFDATGGHFTLTYEGREPSREQAAKDRADFIRKLRREMRKQGKELKYIVATEYENKRIHHHIILNTLDINMINAIWNRGFVHVTQLDEYGQFIDLAEYLVKETNKTFRRDDSIHKRRYATSRNLVKPTVKREVVDLSELEEDPVPIKGYYIPKDLIRHYEHEVTGLEHVEYIMVALDKPRSYKVWPRGKAVTGKEYYKVNYEEVQESLFDCDTCKEDIWND